MANDFLTMREASALFPGRPHINSVKRWTRQGVHGVRLKSIRFGGKRFTRKAWIDDFSAKLIDAAPLTQFDDDDPKCDAAEAKLDAMGIA